MGRISKIKREMIEEANKRNLNESTIEYEDEQSLPEQKAYKDDDKVEVVKDDDYGDGKQGPYSKRGYKSVFDLLDKKLGTLFSKLKKRKKEIKDLDYKAKTKGEKELQDLIKQGFLGFKDIQKREWKQLKYELRNDRWDNFQDEVNTIINNIEEGADNVADSIAHFFKRMNKGIKDNIITPIQKKRFERVKKKTADILKRVETKENNIINKLKKKEEQIKRVKSGSSRDKSTGSQEDFSFQEAREFDRRLVESILNEQDLGFYYYDTEKNQWVDNPNVGPYDELKAGIVKVSKEAKGIVNAISQEIDIIKDGLKDKSDRGGITKAYDLGKTIVSDMGKEIYNILQQNNPQKKIPNTTRDDRTGEGWIDQKAVGRIKEDLKWLLSKAKDLVSKMDKPQMEEGDLSFEESINEEIKKVQNIIWGGIIKEQSSLSHKFNDKGVGEKSLEEHSDDMIVTMGGDDNDYGWYDKSNRQFRNDQINLDDYGDDEIYDSWESYTDSDYYKEIQSTYLEGQEKI